MNGSFFARSSVFDYPGIPGNLFFHFVLYELLASPHFRAARDPIFPAKPARRTIVITRMSGSDDIHSCNYSA